MCYLGTALMSSLCFVHMVAIVHSRIALALVVISFLPIAL